MKRFCAVASLLVMLCGCGKKNETLDEALRFRDRLLGGSGCSFDSEITADYGDEVQCFSLSLSADAKGDATFLVTEPEAIRGISGTIKQTGAAFTFDDAIVAFPMLADGQIAPVAAPWIVLNSLRCGYISSAGREGEATRLTLLDSFEDETLMIDVWFDEQWLPVRGEILYKDVKILTLLLENFTIV